MGALQALAGFGHVLVVDAAFEGLFTSLFFLILLLDRISNGRAHRCQRAYHHANDNPVHLHTGVLLILLGC